MSKRIPTQNIKLKRAYEGPAAGDGTRILIDRLWPRGVKKSNAAIDLWAKDISPSTMLRKWFGHDPARWREFRRRYAREVHGHLDELEKLRALARRGPVTLVFSAHDELHNDAVALRDFLLGRHPMRRSKTTSRRNSTSAERPADQTAKGSRAKLERSSRKCRNRTIPLQRN